MNSRQIRRIVGALALVAAAALLSGCGDSASTAAAEGATPQRGGQLVIGMDQQPDCLNVHLVCGGMAAASMVYGTMFDDMIATADDGSRIPKMALEVPTTDNGGVVENADGSMDVTININPTAKWSDNTPLTCDDIKFTYGLKLDDRWMIGSRLGWDLVTKVDCPTRTQAVYHFKERYAPFLNIVGTGPLPKHALDGKDFNTFMNDSIPVASGPFVFKHWNRSVDIVVERNENYWDAGKNEKPYLDSIKYVFVADTNTLKIQLRTGEVDLISPPPDSSLEEELAGMPRAGYKIEPGIFWEQLAMNTGKAPTNDVNVRLAIAKSINRQQIADVVLKKQVGVLNSTLLPAVEDYYIPAWEKVAVYDREEAKKLLEKSGYKMGGTYYEKNGKPLTVVFKSTAGNALRLKVAQLLQQELKGSGIRMEIKLEPPEVFFGQSTLQGSFHLGLWAWSSGTDPSQRTLFSCDQIPTEENDNEGNNYYRYCNERVSELLKKADVTPDIEERAAMTKEIQTLMAADMPMLPFFQRPETVAYTNRVGGIINNPLGGFVWNSYDWWVAQ